MARVLPSSPRLHAADPGLSEVPSNTNAGKVPAGCTARGLAAPAKRLSTVPAGGFGKKVFVKLSEARSLGWSLGYSYAAV